jgi:hypothetical protein
LGEAPAETSENIKAPELAPKDKRFTGRNKRIAFTCCPEFAEELRRLAYEKKCYQIEILERALESYKKEKQTQSDKKLQKYRKIIQPKPQKELTPYRLECFGCDNCGDEYYNEIAYSYAPSMNEINDYQTYCGNCV